VKEKAINPGYAFILFHSFTENPTPTTTTTMSVTVVRYEKPLIELFIQEVCALFDNKCVNKEITYYNKREQNDK